MLLQHFSPSICRASVPVLLRPDSLDARCCDDGARLDEPLEDAQDAGHVVQVVAGRRDGLYEAVAVVGTDSGEETSENA